MLQSVTNQGNALLNAIRGSESSLGDNAYNMRYSPKGGATFNDFSKHPRIYESVPWRTDGKKSDGAGAYQFLSSTFNPLAKKYNIKDFTPQSQDKAAWLLAQSDYKRKTGDDLQTDLEAGKLKKVANALSGTWTSLPSGAETNKQTGKFFDRYNSALSGDFSKNQSVGSSKISSIPTSIDTIFDSPNSTDITPVEDETFLESITPNLPNFEDIGLRIGFAVLGVVVLGFGLYMFGSQTVTTVANVTKKQISKGLF